MPVKQILVVSESHLIKTFVLPTLAKITGEVPVDFDCLIISPLNTKDRGYLETFFVKVISNEYKNHFFARLPKLGAVFSFLNLIKIAFTIKKYDVIHIHYHHWYIALISKLLRVKSKRYFITFMGSDFNQVSDFHHFCNRFSIKLSDGLFAANPYFLENIFNFYKVDKISKIHGTLFYLLNTFNDFERFLESTNSVDAKKYLGFNKRVITGGYNGAKIVQHVLICDALESIHELLKEYKIVFPMTYGFGKNKAIQAVKTHKFNAVLDVQILEEYLTVFDLQNLRLATDIFVHVQQRDQLASSLLEHLAAGSVAIIGRWLPYEFLIQKDIYAIWINDVEELPHILREVLSNLEFHKNNSKNNRQIILDIVKWENNRSNWIDFYELGS